MTKDPRFKDSHGSTKRRILNAARKRQARTPEEVAVPAMSSIDSHFGICRNCNRAGLVSSDGVCTGYGVTDVIGKMFVARSERCRTITEQKVDREWKHTRVAKA